jgi:type II secretory pathway pseudopilin PulG
MNWAWLADLKKTEIVVGIIGIVVSVIMFWLGQRYGRREREADRIAAAARDADSRVDQVVQVYAQLVNSAYTGGLHGLLMAGIKNLRTPDEIRLARERATARTAVDPLGQYRVEDAKLKDLIDAAEFDRLQVTNDRELRERFCKP